MGKNLPKRSFLKIQKQDSYSLNIVQKNDIEGERLYEDIKGI
jgi:hypothetical protein